MFEVEVKVEVEEFSGSVQLSVSLVKNLETVK
jgi:hypothetical protein